MATFEWPTNILPRMINIKPPRDTKSASNSLTNFEQIVPVIRPPWRVELKFPTLATREKVLSYRVLLAKFEGRANTVRMPLFDFYSAGVAFGEGLVPHSDGTPFSDGSMYSTPDAVGVTVTAVQGARNIEVDFGDYGEIIEAGQYFGIDDDFYMCRGIWWDGSVATIESTPTMRKLYDGARFRTKPYLVCRLTDDDTGEHPLELGMYTDPTLSLIEAFNVPLS